MIIPEGYKLVPVDLLERLSSLWPDGAENDGSSRIGWLPSVTKTVRDLKAIAAAPAPPQPIYDEAKERELFEAFAVNRRGGYGNLPFFVFARKDNGQYTDGTAELAWEGWKACAQSRAKAGEVGHE